MHAVFRETTYPPGERFFESAAFREFQEAHATREGYVGTVVTDVGGGRFVTLTLWRTAETMDAAREALGPLVERLLGPSMTSPPVLLGTGPVVVNDLAPPESTRDRGTPASSR
jgi:hypothetical protein